MEETPKRATPATPRQKVWQKIKSPLKRATSTPKLIKESERLEGMLQPFAESKWEKTGAKPKGTKMKTFDGSGLYRDWETF